MKEQKILIIDDEMELCSLLTEYFSEEEYVVEVSYDGMDGIEKTKSFAPDIILLDHRMPILDGSGVMKEIRAFSSVPIICISAVTNKETIDQCLRLGASEYIFKPINLEDLSQSIESALKKD